MTENKSFKTNLFGGFNKSDVNNYIEKIFREFEFKIKDRDEEIDKLKTQFKELRSKYDEFQKRSSQVSDDKSKIADALIKANEQANIIIEEAKKSAQEEQQKYEIIIENEKEKIKRVRNELLNLKVEIKEKLKMYENTLDRIVDEQILNEVIEEDKFDYSDAQVNENKINNNIEALIKENQEIIENIK